MCRTSAPSLSQLERRTATVIRTLSQKIPNNVWEYLENRLHSVIPDPRNHIELQRDLIETSLVPC